MPTPIDEEEEQQRQIDQKYQQAQHEFKYIMDTIMLNKDTRQVKEKLLEFVYQLIQR